MPQNYNPGIVSLSLVFWKCRLAIIKVCKSRNMRSGDDNPGNSLPESGVCWMRSVVQVHMLITELGFLCFFKSWTKVRDIYILLKGNVGRLGPAYYNNYIFNNTIVLKS